MLRTVALLTIFHTGVYVSLALADDPVGQTRALVGREAALGLEEVVTSVNTFHPLIVAAEQEKLGASGELLSNEGAFDRVAKGDYVDYAAGGYSGTYYNAQFEQPLQTWGSKIIAGVRRGTGTFPIYDDYYATNDVGEIRGGVEVPLFRDRDIDKRRAAIGKSSIQVNIAGLSLEQRMIELTRAAGLTYWEWVASFERLGVFEKLLKVAEIRDLQLRRRTAAGDLARFDQVDSERQVLQRRIQLLAASRSLQRAEFELSLFYRDANGRPRDVSRFKPSPVITTGLPIGINTPADLISAAHDSRPELRRFDFLNSQQEIEVTLAQNDLLPKVDLQSYFSQDVGDGKSVREESEFKMGFKFEMPIQTRSQDGRIAQYSAKIRELQAQAESLRDRIAIEVVDSINAMEISEERAKIAHQEVLLAMELERGERTKFEQGDSNLIFVNLREQTTSDAAVREIEAIAELRKSVVGYNAALGRSGNSGG